jgi:flagellin
MSRIFTNVQSLVAQRVLNKQTQNLQDSLNRLSTGLRINSGADDPAGLIASEGLRAEKVAINAAIDNARRADNVLAIAEGALQETNRLLLDLEDLIDRSSSEAGLSDAEIEANQAQIDNILASIDRIANTTEFNGNKLLDGRLDFVTSGVAASAVSLVRINAAKIPEGGSRQLTVDVVTGSEFAQISATGGGPGGALSAAASIEIRGDYGSEVLSFASGTTLTSIASTINQGTELTGVSATISAGALYFTSSTFGSDAVVSVELLSGSFDIDGGTSSTANGADGEIRINGATARVDGLSISGRSGAFQVELELDAAFGGSSSTVSTSFDITGGGAQFNISPEVTLVGQETIGLHSVASSSLGSNAVGFLSSMVSGGGNELNSRNFATAQRIVKEAQDQVSGLRGRIGGFQRNTLDTTVNSLLVALENTAAAESAIRETDFADETSALTRAQILVNTATSTLQLANAQPQSVLALLQ